MASLASTIGALLIGTWFSVATWGAMSYQAYRFFRHAGEEVRYLRIMVAALWILDTMHIIFASYSIYWYLIKNAARPEATAHIIWSLPVTIAITAVITFIVQLFFARRIFILSRNLRVVTVLILITATARLAFGTLTTSRAIILGSFAAFQHLVRFLVTTGLTLSVTTDFLVTGSLCIYLSRHRTGFSTDTVIDTIIRWTIQTGAVTSFFGLVSMITAIIMPHNLVWLGVHMIISKLYTTTTIANLNSREMARDQRARQAENEHGLKLRPMSIDTRSDRPQRSIQQMSNPMAVHVQREVFVEQDESEYGYDQEKKSYSIQSTV